MEEITVVQAAARWGVTVRQVQRLLAGGRIAGAQKRGRDWFIPASVDKPADLRQKPASPPPDPTLSRQLAAILAASYRPLPWDAPDPVLQLPGAGQPRFLTLAAYHSCDWAQCVRDFRAAQGNPALQLCACGAAMPAAINLGDWPALREVEQHLAGVVASGASRDVVAVAELILGSTWASAYAPERVPPWLREGDFSALPEASRIDGFGARALYFASVKKWDTALALAQTALAMIPPHQGFLYTDGNLRIMCALGLSFAGRLDAAERYLQSTLQACLPLGFFAHIVTAVTLFDGDLLETCLRREVPQHCDAILKLGAQVSNNWIAYHNRLTQEKVADALSPRDWKIMRSVAQGLSYQQTAQKFHLSEGTIKNKMQAIYEQFGIAGKNRRQQLAALVIIP